MIYLGRPRRPMPPPRPPMHPPRPPMQGNRHPAGQNILNQFRDQEGNLDIDKITTTAQQVGKLYGQVSPLITKFIKR
ncbi:MAG TPA: YppG family protein [Lentibacillus sp.]|uniref:YppG family protein n=1 Tax=Lentibacillus sp. TaxID=1925746 RepID=UPI002B4B1605|nr:YppG family protein [Lentibacillus sp.]HLR62339.1 YppG family protein [Lentibacillus sp.]